MRGKWLWLFVIFGLPLLLTALIPISSRGRSAASLPEFMPIADRTGSVADCATVPYSTDDVVQPPELSEELPHFVIPPHLEGATLVDLGLYIVGITEIDPVSNTFSVEGFMDLIWCDPRHIFDAEVLGWDEQVYLEEVALEELGFIWWPDITFPNEKGSRDRENAQVIIYEDGTVEYQERFAVTLEANYDLRQFPFDRQTLPIEIESLAWSEEFLEFHIAEGKVGFSEEFEIPEWNTESVTTHIESVQEIRDTEPFSEFMMEIEVTRNPGFYIWKVFLPLMLIVMLSWSVFWTLEEPLPDSLAISFTGILTVVAYQFVLGDSLPRIPYITFMDAVLMFSFVLMAATIGENILVHILKLEDRVEAAQRIEVISRYAFPAIYVTALVIMVITFGII
ncbi:MAG: hypothetical protein AAFV33_08095 [Chloroflexota bacterium]